MKNLPLELKHGIISALFFILLFGFSYVAQADFVDDAKICFPECSLPAGETITDELNRLCAESGRTDC